MFLGSSLVAQMVKNLPAKWETWVRSLGWEDPLEEDMDPLQYSCLENPHGQKNLAGTPLQYFCLENPMDGGAW